MKIMDNLKKPETKEDCNSIWCEECIYDKVIECEGVKNRWV